VFIKKEQTYLRLCGIVFLSLIIFKFVYDSTVCSYESYRASDETFYRPCYLKACVHQTRVTDTPYIWWGGHLSKGNFVQWIFYQDKPDVHKMYKDSVNQTIIRILPK